MSALWNFNFTPKQLETDNCQLAILFTLSTLTATATVVIVIVIMPQPQPQPQLRADVSISERRIVNQRMSLWRFRFSGKTLRWNLTNISSLNLLLYYILAHICILYLCVFIYNLFKFKQYLLQSLFQFSYRSRNMYREFEEVKNSFN